jgi:hypothetical protein
VVGLILPAMVRKGPTVTRWRCSHGGEVIDEASGHDLEWDAVFYVRGVAVKLVS